MSQPRVALITGASRGIGQAIAALFAEQGYLVFGTATSASGAAQICEALSGYNTPGYGLALDVCDHQAASATVAHILAQAGKLDVLVNNAGITKDGLAMRMKYDDFRQVLDTNLSAVFNLCQLVARPMLKARQGRIINITSVTAHTGNAGQANYCAAKGGLISLTKALAREYAPRSVTVNCVAPGWIDTDMTQALDEKVHAAMKANIPLGRSGTAKEVAHAVAFLADEHAAYITGANVHVNGGMYMN